MIDALIDASPYEKKERRFISTVLKAGDLFIDCGAHEGHYTRLARYCVGPSGLVLSIDPFVAEPHFVPDDGILRIPRAVGAKSGAVTFDVYGPRYSAWNNCVGMRMGEVPEGTREVSMTRLSALIDQYGNGRPVAFLKLDVEGNELDVLTDIFGRGMFPRYVQFESSQVAMIRQKPADIVGVFHRYGYAIHQITGDGALGARTGDIDVFYDNFIALI